MWLIRRKITPVRVASAPMSCPSRHVVLFNPASRHQTREKDYKNGVYRIRNDKRRKSSHKFIIRPETVRHSSCPFQPQELSPDIRICAQYPSGYATWIRLPVQCRYRVPCPRHCCCRYKPDWHTGVSVRTCHIRTPARPSARPLSIVDESTFARSMEPGMECCPIWYFLPARNSF